MQQDLVEKIQDNPHFKELVKRRNRFAWPMAIFILVVYYTYILVIAFNPSVMSTPISPGSVISIGIPIGAGIILLSWIMTGVYVHRANTVFDELTNRIVEEGL
jgi:uncharacterized membrane protein (DUF485 family)